MSVSEVNFLLLCTPKKKSTTISKAINMEHEEPKMCLTPKTVAVTLYNQQNPLISFALKKQKKNNKHSIVCLQA
jgi:ABC-type antimicrobial peptide transport system ATPase subunit